MNDMQWKGLIDSHTHLMEMERKSMNCQEILKNCLGSMGWILDAAVNEKQFHRRIAFRDTYPQLVFSAGIHPCESGRESIDYSQIKEQLQHPFVVALGEVGMDFYWKDVSAMDQQNCLLTQLDLAREAEKPVIIHNREADEQIFQILRDADLKEKGVMHCFSSQASWARKFLDLGYYISFAGNLTYKNAIDIQESAKLVPQDRILIETDAPYLAPQKKRGKPNKPYYTAYTLEYLAELRHEDPQVLNAAIKENFIRLFQPV